jgi:hypothetical protein
VGLVVVSVQIPLHIVNAPGQASLPSSGASTAGASGGSFASSPASAPGNA